MRLADLAVAVRSKNAGPFTVTLDVLLPDLATFQRVRDSGVFTEDAVASLYGKAAEDVRVIFYEPGLAVKVVMPRTIASGSPGDRDVYGAQQHAPLLGLEVPGDP